MQGSGAIGRIKSFGTDALERPCNNLLKFVREGDFRALAPAIRVEKKAADQSLYRPGDNVEYIYFPCGHALIAYVVPGVDGRDVETALVGREGAVGGLVSMGRLPAYCNIVVKVGGEIASIPLTAFNDARQKSVALRYLFARYADCLLAQIFQSAACNAVHSVDQRAAKWLIAVAERTGVREAPVTHEQLAAILGVGRSYVSGLLGAYKARGLVTMRRGCIELLDVDRLKARSCDCNAAVTAHFDEVLKGLYPDESRTT